MPMYRELSDEDDEDIAEAISESKQSSNGVDTGAGAEEEPEEEEEEEEEYEVETILNKSIRKGVVYYLVKWKGWDLPEHNTWQTLEDLENSMNAVNEYEIKLQNEKIMKKYGLNTTVKPRGFARGLQPECITGASFDTGQIFFSIKWKDSDITDVVPAKEVNLRIPEMVIQFYEERVQWGDDEDDGTLNTSDSSEPKEKKKKEEKENNSVRGFDRDLTAERIVGATNDPGELVFLIKWKGSDKADLVKAKEANTEIPQIVIKFYEERLFWYDKEDAANVGEANTHEIVPSSEQ